ncbi:MAG: hypothetical protein KL840_20400 [Aquamicrobium sp.]|nr:hypothetical protein [Aquamicrobium sp.]
MSRVLGYLWRFAVIIVGFACAAFVASAFGAMLLAGDGQPGSPMPVMDGPFYLMVSVLAALFAYHAFAPALAAILIAELLGRRDWLFHALAGAGVAGAAALLAWEQAAPVSRADTMPFLVMLACGLVAGIAYWAVAGRSSGMWLHGR